MNILFVCSKNEWRSRTAETIFKHLPSHEVRSAGTSKTARIRVNRKHIEWAELIFVMEDKHKKRLKDFFPDLIPHKDLEVLHIPDEYQYMDEDLIQHLEDVMRFYFDF